MCYPDGTPLTEKHSCGINVSIYMKVEFFTNSLQYKKGNIANFYNGRAKTSM